MKPSKKMWILCAVIVLASIAVTLLTDFHFPGNSAALIAVLVVVAASNFRSLFQKKVGDESSSEKETSTDYTRSINPQLGWLGLLGFLGFIGIPAYLLQGQCCFFLFFWFFGFFGFFYEGKLSHTLRDERFRRNELRARADAAQFGTTIIFLSVLASTGFTNLASAHIFLMVMLGLCMGLITFLQPFLLYRYDQLED